MSIVKRGIVNRRVTYSKSPNNARSECSIAINPRNPYNIVQHQNVLLIQQSMSFHLLFILLLMAVKHGRKLPT